MRRPLSVAVTLAIAIAVAVAFQPSVAGAGPLALGPEQMMPGSAAYAVNQRVRVLFTDDGASHLAWVRGTTIGSEEVVVARAPAGGGYGSEVPLSSGTNGVRWEFGSALTLKASGDNLVATWEGTNAANRPVWFARSTDAGSTWESEVRADPGTPAERAYACGAPFDDGRVAQVWMVYDAMTAAPELYWRAQDGGGTFGTPSFPASSSPQVPCECCNPDQEVLADGTVLVAYRNNENNQRKCWVARSTDGGASFPSSVVLDSGGAKMFACPGQPPDLAVDGQDVVVVWVKAPVSTGLWHVYCAASTDGGATFGPDQVIDDSNGATFTSHPEVARRGNLVVAGWVANDPVTTHREVWAAVSLDGGQNWSAEQAITGDGVNMNVEAPSVAISPANEIEIAWQDNRDGTDKIYRVRGTLSPTGVLETPAGPSSPWLTAAPNPFTTGTTIRLERPAAGTRLVVHDLAGRRVARSTGTELFWDGRDDRGVPVAAGVYFVRAEHAPEVGTLRIVRIR
ncbi:MAG TPA: hypothetical protein VKU85_00975 [bacterium]|nr:hypothetical protein [bacterium]